MVSREAAGAFCFLTSIVRVRYLSALYSYPCEARQKRTLVRHPQRGPKLEGRGQSGTPYTAPSEPCSLTWATKFECGRMGVGSRGQDGATRNVLIFHPQSAGAAYTIARFPTYSCCDGDILLSFCRFTLARTRTPSGHGTQHSFRVWPRLPGPDARIRRPQSPFRKSTACVRQGRVRDPSESCLQCDA